MAKYRQFVFEDYAFDHETKVLSLHYSLDGEMLFTETFRFNFPFADHDEDALDHACQALFFMAGVSYYKTYLPPEIVVRKGVLTADDAAFFAKTYQRGLGEFFYVNGLDPATSITFPANTDTSSRHDNLSLSGLLIGVGGGKDSLVTVEALRNQPHAATWSLNHRSQLEPLVERIGMSHYWVEREWDPKLLEVNKDPDSYNGHVPISAIIACSGTITAILSGYRDIVVSVENSADEPTLHYRGVAINHQYSKSSEFERDFQAYLARHFGDSIRYYSFLRPYSELRIAEMFAPYFDTYADVFSSCNRAFTHDSHRMFWCGECPKCAFVFLALTPFVDREKLEKLWHGKNLLLEPRLEKTYRELLGIEGDKPLECVGAIQESRSAMRLAQAHYPELTKYRFELPAAYDYRKPTGHNMPADIAALLPN